jgi:pimeloyl-ACP methyl ester carboxylesterase
MIHSKINKKLLMTGIGLLATVVSSMAAFAEGEAGIISLRGQGHFYVGGETFEVPAMPEAGPMFGAPGLAIKNQMYVGYQLVADPQHPYPLVLVHGGGGQASDWFSTPDDRDGWRDYFLAAGFDVYWIDRPGYGRSPTSADYGELGPNTSSGIISFLATADLWPGDYADPNDPSIQGWLASSPPGPYAGNEIAAEDLSLLLDRIGPAIVITHSAGGMTGWWAMDDNPDNVVGMIAIEAVGSNILGEDVRSGLTFSPALPASVSTVADAEGCMLQEEGSVSRLPSLADKPVVLVGSPMGLTEALDLDCATKTLRQAGADASFTYLPDLGFEGNGHFMMADTNSGEIAQVMIDLATEME